ncbi:class I SAM-dependent methyltransferase [Gelidibacter salicanalis]|uniref:Class I SAM-dependent methyltransferase n=1 Tax=Gelidibacter salicanalis TaxID=291193 RepID=A0A5C7AIE1_9FLAO|nr:class I SAM-dependent methyltransferase [Gelidibacter salicanalis]TXE07754.1 class I SAM-dependent methyltransferase [Gelidibacter salicanalis]
MTSKEHWETVYETKNPDQVSWTQDKPTVSLQLISNTNLPKTAKFIDIGGGDSKLVDYLLDAGYSNITVLDISSKAIVKAQDRLGEKAKQVQWIESDITNFQPSISYDLWHDRAAFHFLTSQEDIRAYTELTKNYVKDSLIIGTFSKEGPKKCSGLEITQYNAEGLTKIFGEHFIKVNCLTTDHVTPFDTVQNFQFCSFKKQN